MAAHPACCTSLLLMQLNRWLWRIPATLLNPAMAGNMANSKICTFAAKGLEFQVFPLAWAGSSRHPRPSDCEARRILNSTSRLKAVKILIRLRFGLSSLLFPPKSQYLNCGKHRRINAKRRSKICNRKNCSGRWFWLDQQLSHINSKDAICLQNLLLDKDSARFMAFNYNLQAKNSQVQQINPALEWRDAPGQCES